MEDKLFDSVVLACEPGSQATPPEGGLGRLNYYADTIFREFPPGLGRMLIEEMRDTAFWQMGTFRPEFLGHNAELLVPVDDGGPSFLR